MLRRMNEPRNTSESEEEPYCGACLEMRAHGDDDPRGVAHTFEPPCRYAAAGDPEPPPPSPNSTVLSSLYDAETAATALCAAVIKTKPGMWTSEEARQQVIREQFAALGAALNRAIAMLRGEAIAEVEGDPEPPPPGTDGGPEPPPK